MTATDQSLDTVLTQIGDFGKYQIFIFSFVCFAVILHSGTHVAYVFTAINVEYRCQIPGCDSSTPEYQPSWLHNAVPYAGNKPANCQRYISNNSISDNNCTDPRDFLPKSQPCDKFVYKTNTYSILQEYDLQCDDNLWKLTLVGTINSAGQFFGLFLSGIISDRFGRKIVLIMGMVLCGICGIARTFAPSYNWFLVFEFFDAVFGAGCYICGFVMGVELVGPKKRVFTGTLTSSCYAFGEVFASGAGWLTHYWKSTIYVLYGPLFLLLGYFWIIPESIRWNLSKGRVEEAKVTLRKAADVNGKKIDESLLDKIAIPEEIVSNDSYFGVLKSTSLFLRLINCCFCWITCAFLFFGLTLNSVSLAGNSYLDFILSSLVEIPAYFACNYFIDKLGRKWSLTLSFFITALACLAFIFIPDDAEDFRLSVYLIGKFGATAAFTVIYVLTSELFPTSLRHSMMGTCSTLGRIGSMVAPQTPLLSQIWDPLPVLMFTAMATVAGFLSFLFPETLGIKLPDSIEEAEKIGRSSEDLSNCKS